MLGYLYVGTVNTVRTMLTKLAKTNILNNSFAKTQRIYFTLSPQLSPEKTYVLTRQFYLQEK